MHSLSLMRFYSCWALEVEAAAPVIRSEPQNRF